MIELPPLPLPIERLSQVGPLLHAIDARERILQARIAELEADAERYRYLREKTSLSWSRMGVLAFAHYEKDASDKAALDAAIDAARGKA